MTCWCNLATMTTTRNINGSWSVISRSMIDKEIRFPEQNTENTSSFARQIGEGRKRKHGFQIITYHRMMTKHWPLQLVSWSIIVIKLTRLPCPINYYYGIWSQYVACHMKTYQLLSAACFSIWNSPFDINSENYNYNLKTHGSQLRKSCYWFLVNTWYAQKVIEFRSGAKFEDSSNKVWWCATFHHLKRHLRWNRPLQLYLY